MRAAAAEETRAFWRHRSFPDLGLLKARFTRHRYDLHTHPTYVIALITAGAERVRIGRETVVAPAGSALVVNPEEWHDGEAGADEGWAYRTFYPTPSMLTAVAGECGRNGAPVFSRRLIRDDELASALRLAHESSTTDDPTHAEATMLVALRRLILRHGDGRGREERSDQSGARRRLPLYEQTIEDNLAAGLDLQRLADAAGVTRFQVIRDFRKTLGLTPAAFIRDRRLRRAIRLIEQGATLADAAFAAGFSDQSHLSRLFRAAHGMTPGMFRRAS
jgi:AraC-like DNA-binding protein